VEPASLVAFARVMVPVALSSTAATLGLVVVFFIVFPVLVQGLIAFAVAQVLGERAENQEYLARRSVQRR
jgi:Na+/pantothenate symporter